MINDTGFPPLHAGTWIIRLCAGLLSFSICCFAFAAGEKTDGNDKKKQAKVHVRFGEIFVAGMATLLPGGGTLAPPGKKSHVLAKNLRSDFLIPSGSLISTGASETARVRLGEQSLLRINPDSAVRIFTLHLELERGEVCVQHGKTILPLRIQAGSASLVLERESAADFFLSLKGNLVVTVQGGSARIQGRQETFSEGQRVEITKAGDVTPNPPESHLADWAEYSRHSGDQWSAPVAGLEMKTDEMFPESRPSGEPPASEIGQPEQNRSPALASDTTPSAPQAPEDALQQHDVGEEGQP
ncbi:MAG: hypothetical protein WA705_09930 [Candidatus Ozemobacteraceae bacterium]